MDTIYETIYAVWNASHPATRESVLHDVMPDGFSGASVKARDEMLSALPLPFLKKILDTMWVSYAIRSDIPPTLFDSIKPQLIEVQCMINARVVSYDILNFIDNEFICLSFVKEKYILNEFKLLPYAYTSSASHIRIGMLEKLTVAQVKQLLTIMRETPDIRKDMRERRWDKLAKHLATITDLCEPNAPVIETTTVSSDPVPAPALPLVQSDLLKKLTMLFDNQNDINSHQMVILSACVDVECDDTFAMLHNITRKILGGQTDHIQHVIDALFSDAFKYVQITSTGIKYGR